MKLKLLFLFYLLVGSAYLQAADVPMTLIMEQKFEAIKNGTESTPATADVGSKLGTLLGTGWRGSKIYEAGGMLKMGDMGYLQTPTYDMSANNATVKVSFRAKAMSSDGSAIKVQIGFNTPEEVILPNDEWQNISLVMEKGGASSYVKISGFIIINGVLIDDLRVETSPLLVKAPEAKQPSVATETSFKAVWTKIAGIDKYLLDVYSKGKDEVKEYLLKDDVLTSTVTSKIIEGLQAGKTYYYTVRAQRGEAISDYSNEIEVVEIITSVATPVATPATNISENGFTANWEKVNKATSYTVALKSIETLGQDGERTLLSEDFSGVTIGTIKSPEYKADRYLAECTKLPGWYVTLSCYVKGYIGIAPYSKAGLLGTPVINLAQNSGEFSFVVNMSENNLGTEYEGTDVNVVLYNKDAEVERKVVTLKKGFSDYVVNFTKGSKDASVEIIYAGDKKLLVDKVEIKQNLKAGDKVETVMMEVQDLQTTHYDFEVKAAKGFAYSYLVKAIARTVISGEITPLTSSYSNEVAVALPTGIYTAQADTEQAVVYTQNGSLIVKLLVPQRIDVYNTAGQLIMSKQGVEGDNPMNLQEKMVIVKIGKKSVKAIL